MFTYCDSYMVNNNKTKKFEEDLQQLWPQHIIKQPSSAFTLLWTDVENILKQLRTILNYSLVIFRAKMRSLSLLLAIFVLAQGSYFLQLKKYSEILFMTVLLFFFSFRNAALPWNWCRLNGFFFQTILKKLKIKKKFSSKKHKTSGGKKM